MVHHTVVISQQYRTPIYEPKYTLMSQLRGRYGCQVDVVITVRCGHFFGIVGTGETW